MADVADAGANGARKLFTRCCSSITPSLVYLLGLAGAVGIALFTALVLMFLIHQLTIWLSQDPVRAFHSSQVALTYTAIGWDIGMAVYASVRELVILLLPLWNGLAAYVVQPAIFVVIEVMVLTFSGKAYNGVLSEDTLPFEGHNCPAEGEEITSQNEAAAQFCGNAQLYAKAIGTTRGANSIEGNATLVMSTETARRLSEAGADTILAQIGLAPLLDGVQALAAALLTVTATISDIFWHLMYEVLSIAFKVVFEAFLLLIRSIGAAFAAIFSDGTFMEILGWGIEFLMIFVMEWMLPSVFNVINALMCIMDLFQPDGWGEQLDCIEDSCYPDGSTSTAAWFPFAVIDGYQTFTSIPDIWNKVIRITERVTNKITGQAYDTTSGGRTDLPNFGDLYFPTTPKVQQCNACFTCKVTPPAIHAQRKPTPSHTHALLADPGVSRHLAGHRLHLWLRLRRHDPRRRRDRPLPVGRLLLLRTLRPAARRRLRVHRAVADPRPLCGHLHQAPRGRRVARRARHGPHAQEPRRRRGRRRVRGRRADDGHQECVARARRARLGRGRLERGVCPPGVPGDAVQQPR